MIHLILPSRSRAQKCYDNLNRWMSGTYREGIKWIVSVDEDDPELPKYKSAFPILKEGRGLLINNNKSSVEAINHAAKFTTEDILIVVSEDTDCPPMWDAKLIQEVKDKTDWILKTKDGIQSYICTMPVMDRAYFNRTGTIYHPGFDHLFCDTYLTCLADINGRSITSNLVFPHRHYSHSGGKEGPDELHKRNDATWQQGEQLFIKLMKEFTPQQRSLIKDQGMKNWLRNKGVV